MSANKGVTPICDSALPKCEFLGCLVNSQVEHLCHCHTQSHNPSQVSSVRLSSWGRPLWLFQFSSVQFSHSVMSNSATPWTEAHQVSLSITNSRIHVISVGDAIQPSHPLSSLLLLPSIFPASGSFQMSHLFASGGQSIGISTSTLLLPMNT